MTALRTLQIVRPGLIRHTQHATFRALPFVCGLLLVFGCGDAEDIGAHSHVRGVQQTWEEQIDCSEFPVWEVTSYDGGQLVQNNGQAFRCRSFPQSGWCGQLGYEPGETANHLDAWEFVGECQAGTFPEPVSCTGAPQWSPIPYGGLDRVVHQGVLYACKPWPASGWCQQEAYEPGVTLYWQEAWDIVGPCACQDPGGFDPVEEFHWQAGGDDEPFSRMVAQTPAVAQLNDDDGNGAVDGRDVPDIVFVSFPSPFSQPNEGVLRAISGDGSGELFTVVDQLTLTNSPAVGDIDEDDLNEIIAVRAPNAAGTQVWSLSAGATGAAVADLDADPFAEVIVVSRGSAGNTPLQVFEHEGALKWDVQGNFGGAPTIVDLDDDGLPEIGILSAGTEYRVYEHDGALKWAMPVFDGSNLTSATAFDLDADGQIEVIYADERSLKIWDGATGVVRFEQPVGHGTALEYPVVADVDGDDAAEIVVTSMSRPFSNGRTGILVFGDASDSWAPARKIWNQHSYSIRNVNDDGSIPIVREENFATFNNFRVNSSLVPSCAAR